MIYFFVRDKYDINNEYVVNKTIYFESRNHFWVWIFSLIKMAICLLRSYLKKSFWPRRNHISWYLISIVPKLLTAPSDVTDNPTFLLQSYCSSTEERGRGKVKSPVHFEDNTPFHDWFSDQIRARLHLTSRESCWTGLLAQNILKLSHNRSTKIVVTVWILK